MSQEPAAGQKQGAALRLFVGAKKIENRRRLLDAATRIFEESGYLAPSVDDIAQAAGVSRQTFYRHFDSKLAIGIAFFQEQRATALPLWSAIDDAGARDPVRVRAWVESLLDHYYQRRRALRTLLEMSIVEPDFVSVARDLVPDHMAVLGTLIPVFRADGESAADSMRLADAWLTVYQITDQCSLFASGFAALGRDSMIQALSDVFLAFVRRQDVRAARQDGSHFPFT